MQGYTYTRTMYIAQAVKEAKLGQETEVIMIVSFFHVKFLPGRAQRKLVAECKHLNPHKIYSPLFSRPFVRSKRERVSFEQQILQKL